VTSAFASAVDRLLNQVSHWEQGRWWVRVQAGPAAGSVPPTRADLTYDLVQRLADLGADAEQRPHRPVPRLHDLVLPDQIRVMADDLTAAGPTEDLLKLATEDVDTLRTSL
jgi:hypothetical protein